MFYYSVSAGPQNESTPPSINNNNNNNHIKSPPSFCMQGNPDSPPPPPTPLPPNPPFPPPTFPSQMLTTRCCTGTLFCSCRVSSLALSSASCQPSHTSLYGGGRSWYTRCHHTANMQIQTFLRSCIASIFVCTPQPRFHTSFNFAYSTVYR